MAQPKHGGSDLTWQQIGALLKQIGDTGNVRRASRLISIALLPLLGGIGTYFFSVEHRVASIEQDRADRIVKNDINTKTLNTTISDMKTDISTVKVDVATVKLDVATMKGILQEIQRQQDASFLVPTLHTPAGLIATGTGR